ncbi:adenylate/guanylate cyclase domain-containing protein [Thioflexithrix psekupsensis]|uniref:adenylate/guanylate cyclase domain-containing protein n=1 Tax=Thioflexithrix psekupsensis TaxID=1570016 RepID=UPI001C3DA03A|nr:adenylate/guanylate cyclase domain-containing protein [Thioflexithrix psekupsensis]
MDIEHPESAGDGQLVDMGYGLLVPATSVIAYTDLLLTYAKNEPAVAYLIEDLEKILESANNLKKLIGELFADNGSDVSNELMAGVVSSRVRHDLRTPINAIIGYSEMIIEDLSDAGEEEDMCADLDKILGLARRLLNLINDLSVDNKESNDNKIKANGSSPPSEAARLTAFAPASADTSRNSQQRLVDEAVKTVRRSNEQIELVVKDARLLVVDDKESNRDLLSRRLEKQGFRVEVATHGVQALEMIRHNSYDLVLLDIIMPEMDGYEVLATLKSEEDFRHLPVIMISALDEIDSVVRCIEMGAEDYLQKPFNQVILQAKIFASLERKRLRDREHAFLQKLQEEQEKSEKLLLNILPKPIADRLKSGEHTIADSFPEVTVMFSDLVKFTELSAGISPTQLVEKLNEIFLAFDLLADKHGLEKIKTIGDSYMLVGGLPTPRADHAQAVAAMALDMFTAIEELNHKNRSNFKIRVGIHTGPVVAGVIGKNKFNYDLWGDAVNIASRMESHGIPGQIQISESTYQRVKNHFILEKRGIIEVKGKGEMVTYLLLGHKN